MGMEFYSIDDVRKAVKAAVEFYNHERPHMSLDGMTPDKAAMCEGEIRKKWCSYREKALKNLVAWEEERKFVPVGKLPAYEKAALLAAACSSKDNLMYN